VAALSAGQLMPATQYNFSVFALDGAGNLSLAPLTVAVPTADAAALTDREIFDGLSPACVACHGPGTHSPYFGSFAEFQRLIMNDPTIVVVGDPEASLLIRVLEGNGDPPWASMPLGALNYRQMSARGQTNLAMDELRVWIRAMGGL
jgi:mono/diheme cytochrome c family protein